MMLIGPKLSDDATSIGLTKDAIEVAARSRLRAARLYTEDLDEAALSFLVIQVDVGSDAFSVRIAYGKRKRDLATGLELVAMSWDGGSIGTHGRDSSYILSTVAQHTDKFIDEYLRVNTDSCK